MDFCLLGGAGLIAALWLSLFASLRHEWMANPSYRFGFLVPLLSIFLLRDLWPSQPARKKPKKGVLLVSVLIFVLACRLPVYLFQAVNTDWRLLYWGEAMLAFSATSLLFALVGGRRWALHFLPAIALFFFCIPWPTMVEQPLVAFLTEKLTTTTAMLMNFCAIPVVAEGNLLRLQNGALLGVEEACSGIQSLQCNLMAAWFFGLLFSNSIGRRLQLMGVAVGIALLFNLLRCSILVCLSHWEGSETMEAWHDPAGHLTVLSGVAILGWISSRWEPMMIRSEKGAMLDDSDSRPKSVSLPLLTVGFGLVAVAPLGASIWYSPSVGSSTEEPHLRIAWKTLSDIRFVEIAPRTRGLLRYDEGRHAVWPLPGNGTAEIFALNWDRRGIPSLADVHRPENCLPAAGFELVSEGEPLLWESNGRILPFRSFVFRKLNAEVHVFFSAWEVAGGNLRPLTASRNRLEPVFSRRRPAARQSVEVIFHGNGNLKSFRR
ncbi:MAG: exosortase/archaeosortase family protein [Verrucomicrobiota bacterium]